MKYTFKPDRAVVILSLICLVILGFVIAYVINTTSWLSVIPSILLIIVFLIFTLQAPCCVYVEKDSIVVKQVLSSIVISDITSVQSVTKQDLHNTIRVFGSGGFMGYIGWFRSPKLGKFYMAAINRKELAKVTTSKGKTYVINYPSELLGLSQSAHHSQTHP